MDDKKFLPAIIFVMIIFSFGWYKFFYEPAQREILSMELEARRLREVKLVLDAVRKFLPTR